ncbi:MAG: hypothetical protein ABMB14_01975 [Myxococcota bacterium]
MWIQLLIGCQGGSDGPSDGNGDSGAEVQVDRGPTEIALDGDPNGLWWDAASGTLYIADDNGNRVLKWTDADGLGLVGSFPKPDDLGLGQLVLKDDRLYVTRFGYGTAGDIAWLTVDGTQSGVVDGLDVSRKRIGLTVTSDGRLVDGWFSTTGAVSEVDLDGGGETELLEGLGKPVGVLDVDGTMFVSDQAAGQILTVANTGGSPSVFATMDYPDLLSAGPNASLFTGSGDGGAYQIASDGSVSVFVTGPPETRGVAYDADDGRLFFARHDPDESDGVDHALEIVPVDP